MKKPDFRGRKVVTVKMLKALGACPDAIRAFKRAFPHGARVNVKNVMKARRVNCLCPSWLLSATNATLDTFKVYWRLSDTAWEKYANATHRALTPPTPKDLAAAFRTNATEQAEAFVAAWLGRKTA